MFSAARNLRFIAPVTRLSERSWDSITARSLATFSWSRLPAPSDTIAVRQDRWNDIATVSPGFLSPYPTTAAAADAAASALSQDISNRDGRFGINKISILFDSPIIR